MIYGSKPVDEGNLFLTDEGKTEWFNKEPEAEKFIKPILSSHEFLNGKNRWCLWLEDAELSELKSLPNILKRL